MKYSVKAAARATGVSESSLRTWERRYGIPRPARSNTGRRQYEEADLEVIRRMAALVSMGVPASEAAQVALTEEAGPGPREAVRAAESPVVERIVEAAAVYDESGILDAIQEALAEGWDSALDAVLFPALRKIGERWGEETMVSANEHFATEIIRREISSAIAAIPNGHERGDGCLLLACPEGERHDLGLLGLNLLLLQRNARTVYLGADVPAADMARAVADLEPRAVCMSATLPTSVTALRRSLRALVRERSHSRLFAGGPAITAGGRKDDIPAVILPSSLAEAADVLSAAR